MGIFWVMFFGYGEPERTTLTCAQGDGGRGGSCSMWTKPQGWSGLGMRIIRGIEWVKNLGVGVSGRVGGAREIKRVGV